MVDDLLLPRSLAAGDEEVALTSAAAYPAEDAWWWADGHGQLPVGDGSADDFLAHARPEYEVRGKLADLDRLARDALAQGHREFADLARQGRDDLGKLARGTLPGFVSEERAAAWAAWLRRRQVEEERLERETDKEWELEHGEPGAEPPPPSPRGNGAGVRRTRSGCGNMPVILAHRLPKEERLRKIETIKRADGFAAVPVHPGRGPRPGDRQAPAASLHLRHPRRGETELARLAGQVVEGTFTDRTNVGDPSDLTPDEVEDWLTRPRRRA